MHTEIAVAANAAEGDIIVDGRRLHYVEAGPHVEAGHRSKTDSGELPVVVVPGLMGHAHEWDVLTAALSQGRWVIAIEQRGHGRSDWSPTYSMADFVADLVALLRAKGLDRVAIAGHSLGGLVAARCAAAYPDLVERLVLIDISPDSLATPWGREELPRALAALAAASYGDESAAVAEWLDGDPLAREALMRHYVHHALRRRSDGRLVWRFDAAGFVDLVRYRLNPDEQWQAIDRITAPTLVVRGEHSHLLSTALAAALLGRLRDGRLVEIPNGGHDLGVQQPEAVAAAVREFLTS